MWVRVNPGKRRAKLATQVVTYYVREPGHVSCSAHEGTMIWHDQAHHALAAQDRGGMSCDVS
jgi:hypothetical protein